MSIKKNSKANRTFKNMNFYVILKELPSHYKHLEVWENGTKTAITNLTHSHVRKKEKIRTCTDKKRSQSQTKRSPSNSSNIHHKHQSGLSLNDSFFCLSCLFGVCFSFFVFCFWVISTPNMGLKVTTSRLKLTPQATCLTDWDSQAPHLIPLCGQEVNVQGLRVGVVVGMGSGGNVVCYAPVKHRALKYYLHHKNTKITLPT